MIEIDIKEFHGDRNLLARFLNKKLRLEARVERGRIQMEQEKQQQAHLSSQDLKDVVKRALHHMNEKGYRVTVQKGTVVIREEKGREHHARRKGSVPTVKQTVPYFFPGS